MFVEVFFKHYTCIYIYLYYTYKRKKSRCWSLIFSSWSLYLLSLSIAHVWMTACLSFSIVKITFNFYLPSPLWLCPQTVPTIHVDLTLPILAVDEEVEPKSNIIWLIGEVCTKQLRQFTKYIGHTARAYSGIHSI